MTLAQARRHVWTRWPIGGLIMMLGGIFAILALVKHLYLTSASRIFLFPGEADLHHFIYARLRQSAEFAWLWHLIPTWTDNPWNYVYIMWGTMVWILIGGLLINSARALQRDIKETRREIRLAGWRRSLGGVDTPKETQVTVLHLGSGDPWYKRPPYLISSGVIITVVGGLLLHLAKTLLFANAR